MSKYLFKNKHKKDLDKLIQDNGNPDYFDRRKKFLFIDIETTGLDEKDSDITEIYWELREWNKYCNRFILLKKKHQYFYSDKADNTAELTGLTKEKLLEYAGEDNTFSNPSSAKTKEFIYELNQLFEKVYSKEYILVAHYSIFEKKFFNYNLESLKDKSIKKHDCLDPCFIEKILYPDITHNAKDCAERRGYFANVEHRADADVHKMLFILENQLYEVERFKKLPWSRKKFREDMYENHKNLIDNRHRA